MALGYFDGIHIGHKKVILETVKLKSQNLTPTVFTFNKNPKMIISKIPENNIFTKKEKEEKLKSLGIEILYIVNFLKIKNFSPEKFVKKILYEKLNTKVAICGFNYHFGRGGTADAEDLKNICADFGIDVKIIKPVLYNKTPVSSTRIRNAIKENNILEINQMLGKN
ncbi:MAG: FAD synthetase family protein [Clostridia bacterium]|nr:FAD synthetase family protein [Clostridia bacterium]